MKNVRIYGRPKFVDKFNLLNTFFRKHFTKKEWPSFISNFCFNFNKNTYFTNYMEKNIFFKVLKNLKVLLLLKNIDIQSKINNSLKWEMRFL